METALYDPQCGYYSSSASRIGTEGSDFFTASDVGDLFGRCLARQLVEFDGVLGRPDPFVTVEWGAGRGLLANDVRTAIASRDDDLPRRLVYWAVDRSPAMRAAAFAAGAVDASAPEEVGVRVGDHAGCALAVELFDALPVHRVRRRGGRLLEVAVDVDSFEGLREIEVEPSPEVLAEARRWRLAPVDGDEAEVCLDLAPTLARMTRPLIRGFLVVVDYGYEANVLRAPSRAAGTLLAYHRHRTSTDYLARPGAQDLTAHVNWTALAHHARELGWRPVGSTTQDRFLVANGILEAFEDDGSAQHSDPARVRARLRALQLIHPEAMGRAFQVYVFARGVHDPLELRGLADPFAQRS